MPSITSLSCEVGKEFSGMVEVLEYFFSLLVFSDGDFVKSCIAWIAIFVPVGVFIYLFSLDHRSMRSSIRLSELATMDVSGDSASSEEPAGGQESGAKEAIGREPAGGIAVGPAVKIVGSSCSVVLLESEGTEYPVEEESE